MIFTNALGTKHTAYLNNNSMNKIILSAGAIGSPQLLMLSGIGPVDELQAQGIKVVLDQPMVGQDMADNPMNFVFVPSPNPVEVSLIQVVGITKSDSYIEAASGLSIGSSWAQKISGSILKFLLKVMNGKENQPCGKHFFLEEKNVFLEHYIFKYSTTITKKQSQ